jgi:hypothetical protein
MIEYALVACCLAVAAGAFLPGVAAGFTLAWRNRLEVIRTSVIKSKSKAVLIVHSPVV